METFGRGCFWLILEAVGLLIIAFITQSTVNIPWFIFIPVVIIVFSMDQRKAINEIHKLGRMLRNEKTIDDKCPIMNHIPF